MWLLRRSCSFKGWRARRVEDGVVLAQKGWEHRRCALISCNGRPSFCGNAQEHTHNLQVKQPPRLALDGLAPCVQWRTTTIGPVGGDRIETVSHGEDPRPQENLLGLEAARIATAIVPLVMCENDLGGICQKRDALDEFKSDPNVLLHEGPLICSQRPGLEKNAVGDPELSDIVQIGSPGE